MTLTFTARLNGAEIECLIGSDHALTDPVFCFSLMAAARVVSGGTLVRAVAGYAEVAMPDIPAGGVARVVVAHADPGFRPVNRAWLPLGAHIRAKQGLFALPPLPAGVAQPLVPPVPMAEPEGLRLIPQPEVWRPATEVLGALAFATDDPAFARADALARRLTLAPLVAVGGAAMAIERSDALGAEAYDLTIEPSGVRVVAGGDAGVFYAAITLLTLRETHGGSLPCGRIIDQPRFGWRGQHLDCARHFYQPATILRLLDLMALCKLNRFHWHFADDEAFRLQVGCAPDLWRKTEFRGQECAVPGVFGGGIRSGGSYSPADVAQVLAHAAALHIAVLPEIEVPAHAHAINRAIPGLRDPADNGAEVSIQGYRDNILNPAMEATWDFLLPLADEVAGLFPIGMLHLGCDEMPPGAWDGSPAATRLKAEQGLVGQDGLQGWAMARLAGHLADRGIRAAAWEEAAKGNQGGIGHDALLFSWSGQGPGVAAARRGHDVVMCPAQHTYLDMAHSGDPEDWGAAWAAFIALEDTVNWQPVPLGADDIADRVVGVQGCFWSEFTTADAEIEPMIAPRILGIANKAWDRNDTVDGPRLRALAASYGPLFDRIGWQRHTGA